MPKVRCQQCGRWKGDASLPCQCEPRAMPKPRPLVFADPPTEKPAEPETPRVSRRELFP